MLRLLAVVAVVFAHSAAPLAQPFKLAAGPGGTLLVADFGTGAVIRIEPGTRKRTVVARGLTRLESVTAAPDGTVYAIADEKLVRLGAGAPHVVWAADDEGPTDCAAAADGSVYVARYGDRVDRIAPDGTDSVVASGFDRPHGLTIAADGSLLVADTYAGALRRIGRDGSVTTLASHLGRPMDVAVASNGDLLVADVAGKRLVRIHAGAIRVVARRLGDVTGVVVVRGAIYVSAAAGPFGVARVAPNGLVTRVA